MNKESSVGKILGALGGTALGAGTAYGLGQGLDYNAIEKGISLVSGGLGGLAAADMIAHAPASGRLKAVKTGILLAIGGELAPAALRGVRSGIENQQAQQAAAQAAAKASNSAFRKYVLPGAAAGVGLAAIPALLNVGRAADRIGDGKSIRVSTSIRKRPNDSSDLKLLVMSPEEHEQENAEHRARLDEQKNKRNLIQRILD